MTFFPSRAIFLQIGSLEIRWYAVCILTGALLAYAWLAHQGKKAGYDGEIFDDLFIGALVFGIIGARLWFCLFYDFKGYFSHPMSIIEIWDGGLAIHGGLFAGFLFVLTYCRIQKISFWHIADMAMPVVLIGQALGRWGNYANQECYGNIVDESYYDGILSFLKEGMFISGHYRQPMFFYESVLCILGFVLIQLYMRHSNAKRGDGLFAYLAWYGAIRFWIESQRTDSLMIGNLRTAQLVSLAFMAIGIAGLLGAFRKLIIRNKPVVIFDLDGTLLNTQPVIEESFEHVFAKYAPQLKFTDQQKADFMGPTLEQTFSKYLPDGDIAKMVDEYRQYNIAHQGSVRAFPGARELLDYLKENGYRFCIASSKKTDVIRAGLEVNGMNDYFDIIIGVEQIEKPKPDKETIVKAYKALGGGLDNAIYIGDSFTDVQAAQNAGVFSIAFCSNKLQLEKLQQAKPNRLVYSLDEIKDILKEDHPWTSNMM